MINDNFFESFFGNILIQPEDLTEELDKYWIKCMIDEYYRLLNECKITYKVYRNSQGRHKLERR